MYNARNYLPLPTAFAGGTVTRVGGSPLDIWAPDMAHRTAPFAIHRGVKR